MSRRRMMMAQNIYSLPTGYRKVEYLQSTGTQYFDLGIYPKYNFGVYCKGAKEDPQANTALFGCRNNQDTRFLGITSYNGGLACGYTLYYFFNKNNFSVNTSNPNTNINYRANVVYEGWVNYKGNKLIKAKSENGDFDFTCTEKIGGSFFADLSTTAFNYSIYLFGYNNHINGFVPCACKIYDLEITENDVIVSKLIPCLDNNDKPCMYDAVRQMTFYNEGSGEFLYED